MIDVTRSSKPRTHFTSLVAALALAAGLASCSSEPTTDATATETADTDSTSVPDPSEEESDAGDSGESGDSQGHDSEPLTQAAVLFPIDAGELENWKASLADLIGPSYDEYESSRGRYGLTQQTTVLQGTPMGNFALIYMEGPDLRETTQLMATSPDEWDIAWRDMTTDLHGVDFDNPDELSIETHLVLDTGNLSEEAKSETTPFTFFVPLDGANVDNLSAKFDDIMNNRLDDYVASRQALGIAEEKVFLQNTAVGPGLVIYWESNDPSSSLQGLLGSEQDFDVWFADQFADNHGVPLDVLAGIWAQNTLIADFPAR